jgi:hypothetical protein
MCRDIGRVTAPEGRRCIRPRTRYGAARTNRRHVDKTLSLTPTASSPSPSPSKVNDNDNDNDNDNVLCQPYTNRGEEHEAEEIGRGLFVARSYPSIAFDLAEEVLHKVTLLVESAIKFSLHFAVGFRGNHCRHGLELDRRDDVVGIVTFIGNEVLPLCLRNERLGFADIVDVARREVDVQRVTESIHESVDFGGKTSARLPNTLRLSPPFPPAES